MKTNITEKTMTEIANADFEKKGLSSEFAQCFVKDTTGEFLLDEGLLGEYVEEPS